MYFSWSGTSDQSYSKCIELMEKYELPYFTSKQSRDIIFFWPSPTAPAFITLIFGVGSCKPLWLESFFEKEKAKQIKPAFYREFQVFREKLGLTLQEKNL